ncbi:MAG: DUF389 domain-containing protein [Actinomycetota bacterium]|nr:DUF389 domain-containing protein [Actinomycetota bacterium]
MTDVVGADHPHAHRGPSRGPRLVRSASTPQDRRRVLRILFPNDGRPAVRFSVLMALSVIIALMGLSADSAAVVIGAMLIAPLMAPVLGLSAGIVVAFGRHIARAAATVVVAAGGAVALAWAVTMLLPRAERVLTHAALDHHIAFAGSFTRTWPH